MGTAQALLIADAGGPYEVTIGNSLTLDGSASTVDVTSLITSYKWDVDSNGSVDFASFFQPTATVSVLDRRGKRLGTVYLGHMPESGPRTLTAPLTALLKAILSQVDSDGLRLVYVTDDGYHPNDYYQSVLQQMPDPRRPWRFLGWRRIIDYYHACQYVQQLAEVIFGSGTESQHWAKQMREQLKTRANGVARVLQSAAALRHKRGLWGQAKAYEHA